MPQYSTAVNNARLDAVESVVGASPKLQLYTGAVPTTCDTAATGTLLAEIALPVDWMAAASGSSKVKAGVWTGTASAAGVVGYYRITDTSGSAVGIQGPAGATGSFLEMILDNTTIAAGQAIQVNTYTINAVI